jgi:ABC-type Na+ efflux pump permease subunit
MHYLEQPHGKHLEKEIVMKTTLKKTVSGKVASWTIVGLVLVGTLLISGIADVSEGSGMMAKFFIFFLGAIIVVQVIPGVMLFGAMLKGIYSMFDKKSKVDVVEGKK